MIGKTLILTLLCWNALAHAGATVKGRVELSQVKVKTRAGKLDASGVVIWLEPLGTAYTPRANGAARRTINQKDKRFLPHVVVVETGAEVDFPNSDPFFHNVFSIYNGKRFDLGLYASGETRPVHFNRPGVSYIFCNIHPQMSALVITVNTPYFAVSDAAGNFAVPNLPEGRYRLRVWHERARQETLDALAREIQIGAAGLDLGVISISEEGYVMRPHPNKHGGEYDPQGNRSYRRP